MIAEPSQQEADPSFDNPFGPNGDESLAGRSPVAPEARWGRASRTQGQAGRSVRTPRPDRLGNPPEEARHVSHRLCRHDPRGVQVRG